MRRETALIAILLMVLTGCATYTPQPLESHLRVESATQLLQRYQDSNSTPITPLDFSHGLDGYELAVLSLFNNPQLKSARADANISHAQLFAAGLFPDPTLSYSLVNDLGSSSRAPQGYGVWIGYDLSALWFHGINETIALKEAKKGDLGVLWMEWQSVAEAMMLYSQSSYLETQSALLAQYRALYTAQLQSARSAYQHALISIEIITIQTILLDTIEKNITANEQQKNKVSHNIATLIGIDSATKIPLKQGFELQTISNNDIKHRMEKLDTIRPDLMALQIGYDAQEERLQKAVLSQFPAIGVNLGEVKDTTALTTGSIGITLNLPLFERGRGTIAVATASREKLFEEYHTRLIYAQNEIDKLLHERALLLVRESQLGPRVKTIKEAKEGASKAFLRGDLDESTYLRYATVLLDKEMEQGQLHQSIQEINIALYLLSGKIEWNKGNR